MKIIYHNAKTQKLCEDPNRSKKELGEIVATKLQILLFAIESLPNLFDLMAIPQFRLHALKGDRTNQYSLVIHKGSKWRLIIYPLDKNGLLVRNNGDEKKTLLESVIVEVLEVSEHYD